MSRTHVRVKCPKKQTIYDGHTPIWTAPGGRLWVAMDREKFRPTNEAVSRPRCPKCGTELVEVPEEEVQGT